jgi:hypothetical protein
VHATRPATIATNHARNFDDKPWDASIGDRRSWAGLFSLRTKHAVTAQWVEKYFVGCRAGLDSATYEELETLLRTAEADKHSFRRVFTSDAVCRARGLARRNRRRLLFAVAAAVGGECRGGHRRDTVASGAAHLVDPDAETETNYVKFVGDYAVFYHGATCTEDVRGGLVFNRAPQLGPVVIRGAATTQNRGSRGHFTGAPWQNDVFSAFPAGTGAAVPRRSTPLMTPRGRFIGDPAPLARAYRRRDTPAWKAAEAALGVRADWPEVDELVPYAVKLGPESYGHAGAE